MGTKAKAERMDANAELVDRFHRVLIESIKEKAPAYLDGSFTVAEIYQFLVPYRTHRDRLGLSMNGDYEDTLLRLLAGDGQYLILDSDAARERIRSELSSRNPHTGIYREFAAVEVRLNPNRLPEDAPASKSSRPENGSKARPSVAAGEEPKEDRATGRIEASPPPSEGPTEPRAFEFVQAEVASAAPAGDESALRDAPSNCPECREVLPIRDSLRFCPHCGTNIREMPCRSCGETLDREWRFCVACGVPTAG